MTRKDYIAIAAVLKDSYHIDPRTVTGIAEDLCKVFKADNSAFDQTRFLAAVGVKAEASK